MQLPTLGLCAVLTAALCQAQSVTVRDKLEALPAISFCQDGATHVTISTRHRLRPGKFNLASFGSAALEITGTRGAVTCKFLDVTAVTVLRADQSSKTSRTATTLKVEFYGAPLGTYFPYLGKLGNGFTLPGITGPIHLDPVVNLALGVYVPVNTSTPYLSLSAPTNASLIGVDFFTQAVAQGTLGAQMTNVDKFRF